MKKENSILGKRTFNEAFGSEEIETNSKDKSIIINDKNENQNDISNNNEYIGNLGLVDKIKKMN